jgi:exosortase
MTPATDAGPQSTPVERRLPWMTIGWFGLLLAVCYAPVLARLIKQWQTDEDMGHGFFVPILAGYIAWQKRDQLIALIPQPSWWGLGLVVYAGIQLAIATLGAELFLQRTAFVVAVIGCVWFLGGKPFLKALSFPLFLLFFMVPLPAIIYNHITFPLQLLASRMAEMLLNLVGIPAFREGNILELPGQRLQVVEACSGIRSLLTLTFLSLVYGYFFEERSWMRAVLFISTVPVALIANAGRVTLTGVLGEIRPELAQGFFHSVEGWVVFMIALVLLVCIHQLLSRLHGYLYGKH